MIGGWRAGFLGSIETRPDVTRVDSKSSFSLKIIHYYGDVASHLPCSRFVYRKVLSKPEISKPFGTGQVMICVDRRQKIIFSPRKPAWPRKPRPHRLSPVLEKISHPVFHRLNPNPKATNQSGISDVP